MLYFILFPYRLNMTVKTRKEIVSESVVTAILILSNLGATTIHGQPDVVLSGASSQMLVFFASFYRILIKRVLGADGAAFTYAAKRLGYHGVVVVPENVSPAKLDMLRLYGAELVFHGTDVADTETFARQMAKKQGKALPTIAEGSAGGIEEGSITFPLCRDCVDEYILVSEEEIKAAIRLVLDKSFMLIEGAAALSVACFIKEKERFKNKNIVLVISGKKISMDSLKNIICEV